MKPECQLIGENGNVKMKFGIVSIIISAILFFSMSVQGEMVQRSDGTWVQAPATPPPVKRAPVYNGIGNAIGTYVSSHRSMYSCQKELDRAFSILTFIFVFFMAKHFYNACIARPGMITSSLSLSPIKITCWPSFVR
jgi:hypothetical protein